MIWEDILITRDVPERDVAATMASVFGIESDRVLVIDDLMTFEGDIIDEIGILCERRPAAGDFVLSLTIYLRDDALEAFAEAHEVGILIGRMCQIWDCAALVSDDSVNPYSWLLVRGPDDIQPVHVDAEALDDDDVWVLASVPEAAGIHPPMD
jgi:hypothetical protein